MPKLLQCRYTVPAYGFIPIDERWWEIQSPMTTELVTDCGTYHYHAHTGFRLDGRSGGPLVDYVAPNFKNLEHLACLWLPHDLGYYGLVPKGIADDLLYQALLGLDFSRLRASLIYAGVHFGGNGAYSDLGDPLPPKYAHNLGRFSFELQPRPTLGASCKTVSFL